MRPKAVVELELVGMTAIDPKETLDAEETHLRSCRHPTLLH